MNTCITRYPRALTLAASLAAAAGALAGSDFNGDGFQDLAIGVPGESVGNIAAAGIVQVFYGTANGISIAAPADQVFSQDTPNIGGGAEANDRFGTALATGDFDGDGFDDLAIGIPNEGVVHDGFNRANAGVVQVIYGSASGLTATGNQVWIEGADGMAGEVAVNEKFGAALAAGDFDDDGFDDLAVGVPGQTVNNRSAAGSVHIIYGFASGLTADRDVIITQDSSNILETAEANDKFGSSLAAADFGDDGLCDLAIGVPGESLTTNDGSIPNVGMIQVIYGGANGLTTIDQTWFQGVGNIPGNAQNGDGFGTALAAANLTIPFNGTTRSFLAIGVPTDRDSPFSSGSVVILQGNNVTDRLTSTGVQLINFDIINPVGTLSGGTHFGQSLAMADFGHNDLGLQLSLDLAVGAPGASYLAPNGGQEVAGGAVFVMYSIDQVVDPAQVQALVQGQGKVLDTNEAGDNFGSSLAAADFGHSFHTDLAIGVASEDTTLANVGAVHVLYGSDKGTLGDAGAQMFTQNTASVEDQCETNDVFGFSLGAGSR